MDDLVAGMSVEITTERLVLEPLVEAHADVLFAGLQDDRAYTYVPNERFATVEALRHRYRILERRHSPDGRAAWLNWAVRLRDGDSYIGYVQATIDGEHRALIGYLLFSAWWRRGYGTEAVRALVERLFAGTTVERIEAEIDERNVASRALVRRLGFEPAGIEDWTLVRERYAAAITGRSKNATSHGFVERP